MSKNPDTYSILKEIGFSLLGEGKTLKVRADGYSMYPAIKPGSVIQIEPLSENHTLSPGEIIAWKRQSGFVVHRLVRIIKEGNPIVLITRGDSCAGEDQPVRRNQVAGRVIKVETASGRVVSSGEELIRKPFYLYNRLLVWFIIRIRKALTLHSP
jgi:signal peptidase I